MEIPSVVAAFVISGSEIPECIYKCTVNGSGSKLLLISVAFLVILYLCKLF